MKNYKAIIKKDPILEACPSCGASNTIRRSHSRNIKEKLISHLTIYKTYRCKKCGWRGFLKTITVGTSTLKVVFIYLGLILITSFLTLQILKRLL
ncbi:MAG TPA: hypothetical protein PKD67_05730 [Ignavibacteriaceae bacterium]|nr:hypothetical protein [Ignavibacteriaceae bacterium]